MLKRRVWQSILMLAVATIVLTGLASCSSGGDTNGQGTAKQVNINIQVTGDTINIPLNEVKANWNTRFALDTEQGKLTFMAYIWDGKLNVRADICPPCRSSSFTLTKGTLVCDACGTVFDANTGKGIRGACFFLYAPA